MDRKTLSYADRMAICGVCEFYRTSTGTCGPAIVGKTVTYNGEQRRLCGCIIAIKAAMPIMSCPLDKWRGHLSESERQEVIEFLSRYHATHEIDPKVLAAWYNKAFPGANKSYTNCPPCLKSTIDTLWSQVKDRPVKLPSAEAEEPPADIE